MENTITRREFLDRFLPSRNALRIFLVALKWTFYAVIAYIGLKIAFGIISSGLWIYLAGAFCLIAGLLFFYRKLKARLKARGMTEALGFITAIERLLAFISAMACGALLYKIWQVDPSRAYTTMGIILFVYLVNQLEKQIPLPQSTSEPKRIQP